MLIVFLFIGGSISTSIFFPSVWIVVVIALLLLIIASFTILYIGTSSNKIVEYEKKVIKRLTEEFNHKYPPSFTSRF